MWETETHVWEWDRICEGAHAQLRGNIGQHPYHSFTMTNNDLLCSSIRSPAPCRISSVMKYTHITNSSDLVTCFRMAITLTRNTVSSVWSSLWTVVARSTVLAWETPVWLWTLALLYCHCFTRIWVVAHQSNVQGHVPQSNTTEWTAVSFILFLQGSDNSLLGSEETSTINWSQMRNHI
jgi:hypothetical protein